jgi:hypothetical protein
MSSATSAECDLGSLWLACQKLEDCRNETRKKFYMSSTVLVEVIRQWATVLSQSRKHLCGFRGGCEAVVRLSRNLKSCVPIGTCGFEPRLGHCHGKDLRRIRRESFFMRAKNPAQIRRSVWLVLRLCRLPSPSRPQGFVCLLGHRNLVQSFAVIALGVVS